MKFQDPRIKNPKGIKEKKQQVTYQRSGILNGIEILKPDF